MQVRHVAIMAATAIGTLITMVAPVSAQIVLKDFSAQIHCERNYRDLFASSLSIEFKKGLVASLSWETATHTGHTCGVRYGTADPNAAFRFFPAWDSEGQLLLVEASPGRCILSFRVQGDMMRVAETYNGACREMCGVNGSFLGWQIDIGTKKCTLLLGDGKPAQ